MAMVNASNIFGKIFDAKCFTLENVKRKNYIASPYGWGSTVSRLQSHYQETVYFSFPGLPGTCLINLGSAKGWVDLGAT